MSSDENTKEDSPTMKEETTTTNSATAYEHARDPFFAFIPQLFCYFTRLLGSELGHVQRGVVGFPRGSRAYLGDTVSFYRQNPKTLYDEVISGFTVAIMQVPESIAFSFVAGVPPLSGLHATFWMATVTGLLGGKPGMISGAAGALAVVVADMTRDGGALDYLPMAERLNVLYMTMFVCGIAQILFAVFRLAKLVRLIPETGMLGFMNGLAIIIFLAQLPAFQKCDDHEFFVDCTIEERQWLTFTNDTWPLILSLIHVAICMAIMKFFPRIPVIGRIVPASLVGLLVGTLLEHTLFRMAFGYATRTVKETAEMSGSLPKFSWPAVPQDGETIRVIISYAITLAAIGSVESVLTLQACNEITDTVPKISDSNQEMFAQGLANLICGLFRAMGGDAMIGQSTINIMNGARYRVSSTMSGIFMLLFVVAISGFIKLLPVATLTGVLFMVVLSTFQWRTFMILRYGRLSDSFAIVLVTGIAVYLNLAVAIAVGIIFSALVHAWDSGAHVDADIEHKKMIVNGEEMDVKYVHLKGAIFFSSSRKFVNMFSVADDPKTVVIDFKDGLIIDHSAVAAIQGITHRFAQVDKRVLLINLPVKSEGRLHRTGDHGMLKEQITQSEHVKDTKDIEGGENTGEESGESEITPEASSSPPEHVDFGTVGEVYESLRQFDTGMEPVETEIEKLAREQGELSIHSKKDS